MSKVRRLLLAGTAALALGGLALPALHQGMLQAEVSASESLVGPDGSYAELVRRDKPAIVTITTRMQTARAEGNAAPGGQGQIPDDLFRRFFGQDLPMPGTPEGPRGPAPEGRALGSGFIIDAGGIIVTNNHVVDGATKISVALDDGREFPAKVLGTDARTDIAVLKIDAECLPTVQWGNSDQAAIGDPVIAIGNPFGVGVSVSSGIISARGRDLHNGPYDDFLQVDAAINHGNSGGPLIATDGKVIGITSAIYSPNDGSVGVGFAIPSSMAEKVVAELVANGAVERGYLGVKIQSLSPDIAGAIGLAQPKGALVAEVTPDTPAAKAGIAQGDVVLAVDGKAVTDARALSLAVAAKAPGSDAELTLWRDGAKTEVKVTLGELPGNDEQASAQSRLAPEVPQLGLSLAPVAPGDRQGLGLQGDETGLVVTAVDPDSAAAEKGIQPGDVIVKASNKPVAATADITAAVKEAEDLGRDSVLLLVTRQGEEHFVALPVAAS